MSSKSKEELLAWMSNPNSEVMWGWDAVAALSRDKTNLLLAQLYIARFDSGSYLPPISGRVPMVEGSFEQHIHDFVLDVPRLSFENASLDHSRARLSMTLMGGVQVAMKKSVDAWEAVRLDEIDPLQGPQLHLDLDLNQVPGSVDEGGRILLDLRHSDDFILTFAETEHERRLGGEFFKDLFNQLPDEQRVFALGEIHPGERLLLSPQSFRLRTQSKDDGDEEGAILIMLCMQHSQEGGSVGGNYPYLIPQDAANYSATLLLERRRLLEAGVLEMVASMIGGYYFTYDRDEQGRLRSVTSTAGALVTAPMPFVVPVYTGAETVPVTGVVSSMSFSAAAPHALSLVFEEDKARLSWISESPNTITYQVHNEEGEEESVEAEGSYGINVAAEYELSADTLSIRRTALNSEINPSDPEPPDSAEVDAATVPEASSGLADLSKLLLMFFWTVINRTVAAMVVVAGIRLAIEVHILVSDHFNKSLEQLARKCIKLNFNQAIEPAATYLPRDLACFGRVNTESSTFAVEPMQPLLGAGQTLKFGVSPVTGGISWSVEDLQRSGRAAGSIDAAGLYQAPPAEAITGRFLRVRVTASHGSSGYRSSALVTVVPDSVTLNPLIQLCDRGGHVELAAGQLGEGELQWAVRDPVSGESGSIQPSSLPEGDHTYVATTQTLPHRTYVLDEIEVRDLASGASRSAHVLVLLETPVLSVRIAENATLAAGQVQLQAWKGSSQRQPQWSLPLGGPGSIDAQGVYTPDPEATERFVLVTAREDLIELVDMVFEGHIILPLPLADFPAERAAMSQAPTTV